MKRRTRALCFLFGVFLLSVTVSTATVLINDGKSAGTNVQFNQPGGPNVTVGEPINFTTENPWNTDNQTTLQPYINLTSVGDTEATVDVFNGTWTNTSGLDVSGAELTLVVNDKQTVGVLGQFSELQYRDMTVDDGTIDFRYVGSSGTLNLTVQGLPADTEINVTDADTSTVLDTATTDGNGEATFQLDSGTHTVLLKTTTAPTPTPVPVVGEPLLPPTFQLPTQITIPMTLDLTTMTLATGPSIFILGILGITLGAVYFMRNWWAGMLWGLSVVVLIVGSLFGLGLEIFWMSIVAVVFLLIAGLVWRVAEQ